MRADASAEHRKALAAARQDLTAEHHRTQERMRSQVEKREAEAARRVEEIEAAAYAERQKIKADLEGLRRREADTLALAELKKRGDLERAVSYHILF